MTILSIYYGAAMEDARLFPFLVSNRRNTIALVACDYTHLLICQRRSVQSKCPAIVVCINEIAKVEA